MATREAMQVQQNMTVYESFGTSAESPVSPHRDLDPRQQWKNRRESEEDSLPFPAACRLLVCRCLFLLLGVHPAWAEPSEREDSQGCNASTR